ncbi:MAG: SLC13 family permease [Gammaproteobacteria bacterium]
MTLDQTLLAAILAATVAMFLRGGWRHDMVAMASLLACVVAGFVSPSEAFAGFGHPAVVTVACVLILSQALQTTGAIDGLVQKVLPSSSGPTATIAALTGLAAVLSGFMNNVGALALLMPVALQVASRQQMPPGRVLMPLAFGSILGGMTTLIGTPPNLIVSGFRQQQGGEGFGMFDFTPIGLAVATAGVLFVALVGWRLVPPRERAGKEGFETEAYVTEARVTESSKVAGLRLREVEAMLEDIDAQVIGIVRNDLRVTAPNPGRVVRASDILVIEAEAEALAGALSKLGLKLEEAVRPPPPEDSADTADADADTEADGGSEDGRKASGRAPEGASRSREPRGRAAAKASDKSSDKASAIARAGAKGSKDDPVEEEEGKRDKPSSSDEIALVEIAILPRSELVGRSASDLLLRTRYGINLLAVSRQGRRSMARLRALVLAAGDVLLMQGPPEAIAEFAGQNGCVPLAERSLHIPNRRKAIASAVILAAAIAVAALGILPAAVAFAAGVLASMAMRTVSLRAVYESVDWPVVVLLAALIPVASAIESTGTADLIARLLLESVAQGHAVVALALVLVVTMFLSDVMNNAATAAVMCPIALGTARQLGVDGDAFLMAVAIGASCAFLTPIGHQNNTLILGPGGLRFGDYWRLGLPLEVLVVAISVPLLLVVWPL